MNWRKKVIQALFNWLYNMNKSENHQQWVQALENEFEKQKKLWIKSPPNTHQKTIRQTQLDHFSCFLKTGFPSSKDPNWKFTNINSFLKTVFSPAVPASPISSDENTFAGDFSFFPESHKIFFHNGILIESSIKNLPAGLKFCTWKDLSPDFPAWHWITSQALKRKGDGFYHLAGAFPSEGYVLFAEESCKISRPLHIHFSFDESSRLNGLSASSSIWNFRNFIFLEKGAEINLIESVSAQKDILINTATTSTNSACSSLKWLHLDQGFPSSFYLNQVHCDMGKQARIDRLGISLGAGLSRDIVEVHHLEEKAHSVLLGLALLKQKACRDQRFFIHHSKKEGYSRQFSRGIVNDRAKNIFYGKIHVSSEAVQTNCAQSAKNLLLSATAESYTQPELEIHCGEVKAKHGATVGQFNKDEVFYLQSRGLEQKTAFELLMMGYITDVVNQFPEESLAESLIKNIQKNKNLYLNL